MKYSTRLSDAIHILVLIATNPLESLTSDKLAYSIHTNPSFVRMLMKKLKDHNIIDNTKGHSMPKLLRTSDEISLFDIYKAIEEDKQLLHLDTHTNPDCGYGVNIQYAIKDCYDDIQEKIEEEMKNIKLKDIIRNYEQKLKENIN